MRFKFKQNLAAFFLFLIIFAAANLFISPFRGAVLKFSGPLQKVVWGTGEGSADLFRGLRKAAELAKQKDDLAAENERLRSELVRMKDLEKENAQLRIASEIKAKENLKLLLAEVAGRGTSPDTFFLDRGAADGVGKGMAVISGEKTIYGLVGEVYGEYSLVRALSNADSSINVRIVDTDVSGAVRGMGNGKLLLSLVPRDKELRADSLVVSSPLAGSYPSGLIVGRAGASSGSDAEPFQQAPVTPTGAIEEQRFVFIITDF